MPIALNVSPYFVDSSYEIDQNYMQVLFNPGRPVQSRELSILQSILQNQISQLSGFIFTDGSPVYGGHVSVDTSVIALTLNSTFANTDINLSDFLVGGNATLIVNSVGAVTKKAWVVAVDNSNVNPIIVVKYVTGQTFQAGDVIQVATGVQTQAQIAAANFSNPASIASINAGIFYSGGYFVTVAPQTILLSSSNSAPTFNIGLQIAENIINSNFDATLLDPAQGSFNYQAPGADRLQYNLELSSRAPASTDTSAFYQLICLQNGLVTSQVDYPIFGDIMNTLAQRTYDQSGSFTVRPFVVTTQVNQANSNTYNLQISPGKAYVKGYPFQTVGSTLLTAPKAITTNTVTDYSIATDMGSFVTANNVFAGNAFGFFDLTMAGSTGTAGNGVVADMHIVVSGNINTTNAGTYGATKIGTTIVRDIEFLGLGDYFAYINKTLMIPLNFTAVTGNAANITFPAIYGTVQQNAYANVIVSVNTGGNTQIRTISTYANGSQVATFSVPLTINANSTSNVTLLLAPKDINSIVLPPNATQLAANCFATQNAAKGAILACMDIAVAGKTQSGNTTINDPTNYKLIYPLPNPYVAQGTITNVSFYRRKNLWSQTFTSGNLTIASGTGLTGSETLPYGFANAYLSDVQANLNFFVTVRNAQSSNLSNGQIINWNHGTVSAGNGIYQASSVSANIAVGTNNTFIGDVVFTVLENSAQNNVRRTKTLFGNSANTTIISTDKPTNGTAVIGTPNVNGVYIDTTNGYAWFTSYNDQALTPGANQSFYIPDVFNIIRIYDSGNTSYAPNSQNVLTDITNRYYLTSGQTDNYYDFSTLVLKSGCNPPAGQTVVLFQAYSHDTTTGFFDVDSYSATAYNNGLIPYYASPNFGPFSLRDSIDFRPSRPAGTTQNVQQFVLNQFCCPDPNDTLILTFQFYLPRIDKLTLTQGGVFTLSQGTPSQYPVPPADSSDAMTLYVISVPAFTSNIQQIGLQYVENKRYTMKEIGALDSRITNLETVTQLTQLENQTTNQKILYQDGITVKSIYGSVADNFGSFSVAGVLSPDLAAYLRPGTLSPFKLQTAFGLNYISNTNLFQLNDKTYTLPFVEVAALSQNTFTETEVIQPYLYGQFTSTVEMSPETDFWFANTLIPQIIAPPTSTTYLPELPAPPSVAGLIPASGVVLPSAPIVASSLINTSEFFSNNQVYYYQTDILQYLPNFTSFGVLSPITNWFGTTVNVNAVSQSVQSVYVGQCIPVSGGGNLGATINTQPITVTTI